MVTLSIRCFPLKSFYGSFTAETVSECSGLQRSVTVYNERLQELNVLRSICCCLLGPSPVVGVFSSNNPAVFAAG